MKLKVLARGRAMVCPPEAAAATPKRFIGRKWDPSFGNGRSISGAWVPVAEVADVPLYGEDHPHFDEAMSEYRQMVQQGDLWAADQATAEACEVKFDPTFGGEELYKSLAKKSPAKDTK